MTEIKDVATWCADGMQRTVGGREVSVRSEISKTWSLSVRGNEGSKSNMQEGKAAILGAVSPSDISDQNRQTERRLCGNDATMWFKKSCFYQQLARQTVLNTTTKDSRRSRLELLRIQNPLA